MFSRPSFRSVVFFLLVMSTVWAEILSADSCANPFSDIVLQAGVSTIGLAPSNLNSDQMNALGSATAEWNNCAGSANFLVNASGDINVGISFFDRQATNSDCSSSTACACFAFQTTFDSTINKHRIIGGTIKIFKSSPSGRSCNTTTAGSRLDHVMAHELGHVLGLDDITDSTTCAGRPMLMGSSTHVGVTSSDCTGAHEAQSLSNEPPPQSETEDDPLNQDCTGGGCSPILIDLDRRGFRLTHWSEGVLFDIDDDGSLEALGWTRHDSGDAFLVLDRNKNGMVDAGNELFGNYSPQPASGTPNGYLALAVYDGLSEGGNLDGFITKADDIFDRLQLWIDRDHDGVSDADEMASLSAHCVRSIAVQYMSANGKDRHGNEFRHFSPVELCTGRTRSVDVFFVNAGSDSD